MSSEVMKSALTAFAPPGLPYMAAAGVALELFELKMLVAEKPILRLVASTAAGSQFTCISWGKVDSEEFPTGIIAVSSLGRIHLWNPNTPATPLRNLASFGKQVGGLEFNAHSPNLLACGVEKGLICIWDIAQSFDNPYCLEAAESETGEVSFLSWNKVDHKILASTSDSGVTVVWDSLANKQVLSFSDYVRRCKSLLQWNPYRDKELMVASDDDNSPSLKLWDIRNTKGPLKDFPGHKRGVIAMSWCPHDHSYIVTCSKDKSTIFWDAINAKILAEFSNDYFDIHFHPSIPNVISASSSRKFGVYEVEFDVYESVDEEDERIRKIGRDHIFCNSLLPFDTTAIHNVRIDTEIPDFYVKKAEAMLSKYELSIGKVQVVTSHPEASTPPIKARSSLRLRSPIKARSSLRLQLKGDSHRTNAYSASDNLPSSPSSCSLSIDDSHDGGQSTSSKQHSPPLAYLDESQDDGHATFSESPLRDDPSVPSTLPSPCSTPANDPPST